MAYRECQEHGALFIEWDTEDIEDLSGEPRCYVCELEEQIKHKDEAIVKLKAKKRCQAHELTRLAELRRKHERKFATLKGQLKKIAGEANEQKAE